MASLTRPVAGPLDPPAPAEGRRAVRDSLIVTLGGQLERALGTVTALMLRWGLDPAQLGVYTGLRLYLYQTNRTSLGIGLGAVQEIPIYPNRDPTIEYARFLVVFEVDGGGAPAHVKTVLGADGDTINSETAEYYSK